jgi:hypothetical protein
MTLKLALGLLLSFAAFAQTPGPNPMTVKVRPPTPDVAATKVRLLALSDDAAKTKEILADDEQALAQILPYSVLVKNESARKLRAISVTFAYTSTNLPPKLNPRKLTLTLTAMSHEADPGQIDSGGYQFFSPVQAVNQYLSASPQDRKGGHFKQAGPAIGPPPSSLADAIQQGLAKLNIAPGSGFEAYLEGVVFEDYSFVGSQRVRESLIRYNNLIH